MAYANATADDAGGFSNANRGNSARELPPYLQCAPYARQTSGIQIYGNARTWWSQAAGRYERGRAPRIGAVMTFKPHRNMVEGHVATVSKIIDKRTVLLDHANWSPINGRRGQIERGAKAVDISRNNDWSEVQVWYAPLNALGKTRWPLYGFIYNNDADAKAGVSGAARSASKSNAAPRRSIREIAGGAPLPAPIRAKGGPNPSPDFNNAFAGGLPTASPSATIAPAGTSAPAARPGISPGPSRYARSAAQASWDNVSKSRLGEIERERAKAGYGAAIPPAYSQPNASQPETEADKKKRGFVSKAGSIAGDVVETAVDVGVVVGKGVIFVGKGAVGAVSTVVGWVD